MKECLRCTCYDADFGCTMPSIDRSYACPLETGSNESNRSANILYNMTLDMDYMDYAEQWQKEINEIAREIDILKEKDSTLFHVLETLAYANEDKYDWFTGEQDNA